MCLKKIELVHAKYWLEYYPHYYYLLSFPATKLKEVEQIIVNKEKTEEGKAQALKLQAKLNGEQELVFSIGKFTKFVLIFIFQAPVCLHFHD